MAVDDRTDELMGHLEAMLQIADDINQDMKNRMKQEEKKEDSSKSKIEFYESQIRRLVHLHEILDDDVLTMLIRIRNISGPIEYFKD